jgi:hypothetical protein
LGVAIRNYSMQGNVWLQVGFLYFVLFWAIYRVLYLSLAGVLPNQLVQTIFLWSISMNESLHETSPRPPKGFNLAFMAMVFGILGVVGSFSLIAALDFLSSTGRSFATNIPHAVLYTLVILPSFLVLSGIAGFVFGILVLVRIRREPTIKRITMSIIGIVGGLFSFNWILAYILGIIVKTLNH